MVSDDIHLWPEERTARNDELELAARIEQGDRAFRLWYRVPAEWAEALTDRLDPFVVATVMVAMQASARLVVHGTVSPSLLRNLEDFQAIWACWKPDRYRSVEIVADREEEPPRASADGAVACFSGGVDSAFTLYRHALGTAGRRNRLPAAAVMADGFEPNLDTPEKYQRAVAHARAMLEPLNIPLVKISSNWKRLGLRYGDTHGAGLIACLRLFAGGHGSALFGSTLPYRHLMPWGSSVLTDSLLSSDTFECRHDGAEFTRDRKVQALIDWGCPVEHLRVCWHRDGAGDNCGRCAKCVRTILCFRVLGEPVPACFPGDVSNNGLSELQITNDVEYSMLATIVERAWPRFADEPWVKVLTRRLERYEAKR